MIVSIIISVYIIAGVITGFAIMVKGYADDWEGDNRVVCTALGAIFWPLVGPFLVLWGIYNRLDNAAQKMALSRRKQRSY